MTANPLLGVGIQSIGGLAAASFYIPFRRVKDWSWESYWLVQGLAAWVVMPALVALLTVPDLVGVLSGVPWATVCWVYLYGILWGIGGLTFGLSMRYLGMSLGYAVALGFCAAFGTLLPPIFRGQFHEMASTRSGLVILVGVAVCLVGIAVCGYAGICKERELTDTQKRETIREFALLKGFAVAIFAGVMSACLPLAFDAGKQISKAAEEAGANVFQDNPVFVVALAGGFTTNLLWCLTLNIRNKSLGDYLSGSPGSLTVNYTFSALAGVIWYLQLFFYGIGSTILGARYKFSSWTIHMAFIIVFSNLWGIYFREWKGVGRRTGRIVWAGLLVLVLSTVLVGYGRYLEPKPDQPTEQTEDCTP
jgi:L-rhamnose-H+ transport protein